MRDAHTWAGGRWQPNARLRPLTLSDKTICSNLIQQRNESSEIYGRPFVLITSLMSIDCIYDQSLRE